MGFWNNVRNEWKTTFTDKNKRKEFIIAIIAIGIANIVNERFFRQEYGFSFWKSTLILFFLLVIAEIIVSIVWRLIQNLRK